MKCHTRAWDVGLVVQVVVVVEVLVLVVVWWCWGGGGCDLLEVPSPGVLHGGHVGDGGHGGQGARGQVLGCQVTDIRSWVRGAKCQVPGARCQLSRAECLVLPPGVL